MVGVVAIVVIAVRGHRSVRDGRAQHGRYIFDGGVQQQAVIVDPFGLDAVVYTLSLYVLQGTVYGRRGDHLVGGIKYGIMVGVFRRVVVGLRPGRAGGGGGGGDGVVVVAGYAVNTQVTGISGEGRQRLQLGQIVVLFGRGRL